MYCLGIDQSLRSTGLCLTSTDESFLEYKLIQIDEKKDKNYQWINEIKNDTLRKINICYVICEQIVEYLHEKENQNIDVGCINIEGLAFGMRGDATRTLGGLQFMIINEIQRQVDNHSFCMKENGIIITAPTSLKKFATGKGSSKKEALYECMPDDIQSHFGEFGKTKGRFDLVDAFWLSRYGVDKNATRQS